MYSESRCYNIADVVFVLDSSGSIRSEDWNTLLNFVSQVVGRLEISRDEIHVGALRYATNAAVQFRLDASFIKSDIQNRIVRIDKVEGQTNMMEAIRVTSSSLFNRGLPGDRADAPDIMVIISDGRTDSRDGTIDQANRAKARGISVIPVGIDIDGDMALLRSIASEPRDVDRLRVTSYNQLLDRMEEADTMKKGNGAVLSMVSLGRCPSDNYPGDREPRAPILLSTPRT